MALDILKVALLSMLPISELRGAIPLAKALGISPAIAFFIATIANIAIVPIVFFFLNTVHKPLAKIGLYRKLFDFFVARTRTKAHSYVEKYGYFGLAVFVAVPLPFTGAYTGTLAAWLFGMRQKKAAIAIALGVVIAGIIITIAVESGSGIWRAFFKQ